MSLLGSQVYANTDKPIWLSATNGTMEGNLTVTGNLQVDGATLVDGSVTTNDQFIIAGTTDTAVLTTDVTGATLNLIADTAITFGRDNTTPNTTLTLSAPGAGLDNFTTNFLYAIGPVPTNLINTPRTINPVPTSPAEPFLVDTAFPVASGQAYDVQVTGIINLISGTPDPDDAVIFSLDAGTGTSITAYTFYPSGPGQSGNWAIRQRIVGNAIQPSLALLVQKTLAGTSTAVYGATLNYFSAVRVA
jgi:hypothetical protein